MTPKILLVEDEPGLAMVLEDDLLREGYQVTVVKDGEGACHAATGGRFDLILLDVMLPRMDGFEVCRFLRAAGVESPVLMLTARAQESDKVVGLEMGADDYVTKPYGPRELRARIKALLRRASKPEFAVYRFGPFELDAARCELRRDGVVVDLKPLEFRLLAVFVGSAGRVLSRQQLLDRVWGKDVSITERVVDNQVTQIRKKIELDPGRPRYIVSLRGLGYRFDAREVTEP